MLNLNQLDKLVISSPCLLVLNHNQFKSSSEVTLFFQGFCDRFRAGAQVAMLNLPGLDIDIDSEIERYKQYADKIRPFVIDCVDWLTGK